MGDALDGLNNDQLRAFIAFQQQAGGAAAPPKRRPAAKAKSAALNPMAEEISGHYKNFYDLGAKHVRLILVNTTQCSSLNEINVSAYTLEEAFYILWTGYGIFTHTKVPRSMNATMAKLIEECRKCYVAKRKLSCVFF